MNGDQLRKGNFWIWGAVMLVVMISSLIRFRFLNLPLERDEGEYAYIGQLLLQGISPFKLAYSMKLPGTAAVYALFMFCFGQSPAGIHFGLLLVNAATTILIFLFARKLLSGEGAVIACATYALASLTPSVMGLSAHATQFVVFFAMAGALVTLRASQSTSVGILLAGGLLFGMATLMKQHGIFFSLFGAFLVVWRYVTPSGGGMQFQFKWGKCLKHLAVFFLGVVSPFLLVCVIFARAGEFHQFWFWTFELARSYGANVTPETAAGNFADFFQSNCDTDILLWMFAAMGLVAMCFDARKDDWKLFVLVLLTTSLLAVCPGFYFRPHYFVLVLPAVALLVGYLADFSRTLIERELPGSLASRLPTAVFAAACVVIGFTQREFLIKSSMPQACWLTFGLGNPFTESQEIGRFIQDHTTSADRIAVIGSEPEVYFYAKRNSATGFIYGYDLMLPNSTASALQQEMIQEIESNRPAFLVDVRLNKSWLQTPQSDKSVFRWSEGYAQKYYDLAGVIVYTMGRPVFHWGAGASDYLAGQSEYVAVLQRRNSPF